MSDRVTTYVDIDGITLLHNWGAQLTIMPTLSIRALRYELHILFTKLHPSNKYHAAFAIPHAHHCFKEWFIEHIDPTGENWALHWKTEFREGLLWQGVSEHKLIYRVRGEKEAMRFKLRWF